MSEMCTALKVTRQGYHAWRSRPPSAHAMRDAELAELISQVREKARNIYGAPKTFMRLRALGVRTSRKRAARIMRGRGWLYLALVMDIRSWRIVGWSMGPNITAELADEALRMALDRRNPPEGCVHHSNHGSQYVSLLLSKTMHEKDVPLMGSISSPWDNAAMKSPMGIVKAECVHARTYATREEASLDLFEYIEVVYNRARIHSALGYFSPVEFEGANRSTDEGRPRAA